jgi:hypothetical protein
MNRNTTHWIIIILAALGLKAAGPQVRGVLAILFVISATIWYTSNRSS